MLAVFGWQGESELRQLGGDGLLAFERVVGEIRRRRAADGDVGQVGGCEAIPAPLGEIFGAGPFVHVVRDPQRGIAQQIVDGVGVVGWMVPGGREIAIRTAELMKKYDVVIWAHHGMFCSGEDFDLTFGLLHTVEKSAEILVKILSMTPKKLQTITPDNFRSLAKDFKVSLPEEFLYEKQ